MDEIIQEYGGMLLGLIGGIAVLKIVSKLVFSGGILAEVLTKIGIMAC
ncbi:MAG: hypothetical protein J6A75_06865 [Lachnospiraceae bacterium]|nr:hypothetical protein [Lachnospiraceae bacterium]